jgi:DNA repair exonuclease SbcCD ATPase subunit
LALETNPQVNAEIAGCRLRRAARGTVTRMGNGEGLKDRVTRQGEEAIGRLAQELLENPVVSGALSRAFETRERAMRAQEVAMGALNLPSASDLERLTRRVRSVSQRLEGIEDGLDRLEDRLQRSSANGSLEERLANIERALERLEAGQTKPAASKRTSSKAATANPADKRAVTPGRRGSR